MNLQNKQQPTYIDKMINPENETIIDEIPMKNNSLDGINTLYQKDKGVRDR